MNVTARGVLHFIKFQKCHHSSCCCSVLPWSPSLSCPWGRRDPKPTPALGFLVICEGKPLGRDTARKAGPRGDFPIFWPQEKQLRISLRGRGRLSCPVPRRGPVQVLISPAATAISFPSALTFSFPLVPRAWNNLSRCFAFSFLFPQQSE